MTHGKAYYITEINNLLKTCDIALIKAIYNAIMALKRGE